MITVDIHRDFSGLIRSISVSDHSGFADSGSDIICAGASVLVYTAIGAIQELCGIDDFYRIIEGSDEDSTPLSEIVLPVSALSEEQLRVSQVILHTVEIGYMQLEESVKADYGNQYIRVNQTADDK